MIEKLTEKDVNHVIDLAKLKENDIDRPICATGRTDKGVHALSQYGHADIDVDINESDIMISPSDNVNRYNDDVVCGVIDKKDVLKMANKTNGDFIVVSRVIND